MTKTQTGYTTQSVKTLTNAQLVEEALQNLYDTLHFAPGQSRNVARDRRNACFAEISRRLEAAERLAATLSRFRAAVHGTGEFAYYHERGDWLSDCNEVSVDAEKALAAWRGEEENHG